VNMGEYGCLPERRWIAPRRAQKKDSVHVVDGRCTPASNTDYPIRVARATMGLCGPVAVCGPIATVLSSI